MSAESIALITPRAAKLERGSHSHAEITEEDINHALGRIRKQGASLLLRVKYAKQERFSLELCGTLYKVMLNEHRLSPERLTDLCKLAIHEHLSPALCQECNGRASVKVNDLVVTCPSCLGTGRARPIDHAAMLGMDDDQWKREERSYDRIMAVLAIWEAIGMSAVAAIRKDEEG